MHFPNHPKKHLEDALFNPTDLLSYHKLSFKNYPTTWIITWQKHLFSYLKRFYKAKEVNFGFQGRSFVVGSVGVLWLQGIGSPHAVANCEEMIVHGARDFYLVGTAGGLQHKGVFVPDQAIRDEGTSHHYSARSKYAYPNKSLSKKLQGILKKYNIGFDVATTWTIDAPYRETKKEIARYKKEGVATVEMECSALFTLGTYRKRRFVAVLTVSDVLGEKWEPEFNSMDYKKTMRNIAKSIVTDVNAS